MGFNRNTLPIAVTLIEPGQAAPVGEMTLNWWDFKFQAAKEDRHFKQALNKHLNKGGFLLFAPSGPSAAAITVRIAEEAEPLETPQAEAETAPAKRPPRSSKTKKVSADE